MAGETAERFDQIPVAGGTAGNHRRERSELRLHREDLAEVATGINVAIFFCSERVE